MRAKLAILLLVVALLPLCIYGVVAVRQARRTTRGVVVESHERLARRAASEIALYVRDSVAFTAALAEHLAAGPTFSVEDREQAVRTFRLGFRRYRDLQLLPTLDEGFRVAPPRIGADGVPVLTIRMPVMRQRQQVALLEAQLDLTEMWDEVERIRVGQTGFLLLFAEDGTLMAHGNPQARTLVFRPANMVERDFLRSGEVDGRIMEDRYINEVGDEVVGLGVTLPPLDVVPVGMSLDGEPIQDPDIGLRVVVEQTVRELQALESSLISQLYLIAGMILVLMLTLSHLLGTKLVVRPIQALVNATARVAKGDLDAKLALPGRDELATLGRSFNHMTAELKKLTDTVRRQERVATIGQIAAGLAHDLKHPVQNLKNAARLMHTMADDRQALDTFQSLVKKELGRLEHFLDDLRRVTKTEKLPIAPLDLKKVAKEQVEHHQHRATDKGVTLGLHGDLMGTAYPSVRGDESALQRVLDNLIENAVDACEEGGMVDVAMEKLPPKGEGLTSRVAVMVKDTGCGIPEELKDTLFDAFMTTKKGGLGMGLAVTRKLVEAMGGEISVESSINSGTVFRVVLPASSRADVDGDGPVLAAAGVPPVPQREDQHG